MSACFDPKGTANLPILVNHNTGFEITIPPRGSDVPNVPDRQLIPDAWLETYILILGMVPSGGVMKLALLNPEPSIPSAKSLCEEMWRTLGIGDDGITTLSTLAKVVGLEISALLIESDSM